MRLAPTQAGAVAFALAAASLLGCAADDPYAGYVTRTEEELRGKARTSLDHPEPTEEQLARRKRSIALLEALGVPAGDNLPVIESESATSPRGAKEIAERCIALAICAVYGETGDHPMVQDSIEAFAAASFFTPKEKQFVANPKPAQQELVDHAWGYECVHVLLWALGYVDQLKPNTEIADVENEMALIAQTPDLAKGAKLRPIREILDQADLYYHLHWSAIELRLAGKESPKLNEEVIVERHRALNWLIRYMSQEWDEISTDT